jgi:GT2 family glycosyltransferase
MTVASPTAATAAAASTSPTISIVCVSHGRPQELQKCIASCVEQHYDAAIEIVVVLNPADTATETTLREKFPGITIISTHKNLGFFPALNIAIANTHGQYVMTVDDDAWFLQPDALAQIIRAFESEPELGAATCTIEGPAEDPPDPGNGDRYMEVFKTGFTMMPKAVFTDWVGYYPDLFFRSAGETYVCTALWDMGKRVKRLRNVRMYHEQTMVGRSDRDWKFHGLRSQILVVYMRQPAVILLPALAAKAFNSFRAFLGYRMPGTWIHAWWSSFVNLSAALRLRRPIRVETRRLLMTLRRNNVSDLSQISVPVTPPRQPQAAMP